MTNDVGMKEFIATLLWTLHIRPVWVRRNAKLFLQAGKCVSWEQLYNKEHDYPYYFKDGIDTYPTINK